MPNNHDSQQNVVHHFVMDSSGGATQTGILRNETIRVREAVITGTLASAAATRVYINGIKDPYIVSYLALIEGSTAGNWVGQEYGDTVAANHDFTFFYDGPTHASTPNSFLFSSVGTSLQGQPYRIWFRYVESPFE